MKDIINIQEIDPKTFTFQDYSSDDETLIPNFSQEVNFNSNEDYIEYFIYDLNRELLYLNIEGHNNYKNNNDSIVLNPTQDLKVNGFDLGSYYTVYNFLKHKLESNSDNTFYIKEISSDRTEIRLDSTKIEKSQIIESVNKLQSEIDNAKGVYRDFYLNFGNNNLLICVNILLDTDNSVLIKLYEPLPNEFTLKNECWVNEKISESKAYNINIEEVINPEDSFVRIKGPNFNQDVYDLTNNSSNYESYNSLIATNSTEGSGSIKNKIDSLLNEKGIELNIDYNNFEEFVHFSSVQTRLENFYYKLSLLEDYSYEASLSTNTPVNYYVSSSNLVYQNKINDVITNFDGYEYFLFYGTGSNSWPKQAPDFVHNYSTGSVSSSVFFASQSLRASTYDEENIDNLTNTIPTYLRDDSDNDNYTLFVEMIGQHFDNIWIYLEDIPKRFDADNRVNYGISRDLVSQVLRDFGVKIYQNNFSTNNLYSALLGITPSGSLYNFPNTTGSLPTPEGYEYINTYVTPNIYDTSSLTPSKDINDEIYKRIYHNLPFLLKKKGTNAGLRALITTYGIPNTILEINEFGGQNQKSTDKYNYWYNKFNYCLNVPGSGSIGYADIRWSPLYTTNQYPKAIEFRFKTPSLPTSSIPYSQSLINFNNNEFNLVLEYTGSAYTTGSYSGSAIDPNNQYALLRLYHSSSNSECSVYLPFFDGDWWSILINANSGSSTNYTLYAKNKIYNGNDGYNIGFQSSSSFTSPKFWDQGGSGSLYLGSSGSVTINSSIYNPFSGSFQEFRYYTVPLSESVFDNYVMNPASAEGNEISGSESSFNSLLFRASLGGVLDSTSQNLYTSSIHPSVTGSIPTSSFSNTSSLFSLIGTSSLIGTASFSKNEEIIYENSLIAGLKSPNSKKLKSKSIILPYSSSIIPDNNTISPFISIQQNPSISSSLNKHTNYMEIGFSPQNEINHNINETFGNFNIGEYIGDPRHISSSDNFYPDLNTLRNQYFEKYTHNFDVWDYIRLIKYFDNSLFKMINDWIPARTNTSTGIIIKQHLLERNKYPVPRLNISNSIALVGSPSNKTINIPYGDKDLTISHSFSQTEIIENGQKHYISDDYNPTKIFNFEGSKGGVLPTLNNITSSTNEFVNITQSWTGINRTPTGSIVFTQFTQEEFFNGEISGSNLRVTTQSLSISGAYDPTFDALENNVSSSRSQSLYMDVDYSHNQIYATNFSKIINNTADRADVQSSNYTSLRHINPRYKGTKLSGINYNIYTPSSSLTSSFGFSGSWNGDTSFGKSAVIDSYKSFGLYFNEGIRTYPELPKKTSFTILYMFDEEGNIYDPSLSGSYYDNFIYTFGKDDKVIVNLRDLSSVKPTTIASIVGERNIYHSNASVVSPFTTQSGSGFLSASVEFTDGFQNWVPSPPHFTTGSSSPSVLTASVNLSSDIFIPNMGTGSVNGDYLYQVNYADPNSRAGFTTYPTVLVPALFNNNDIVRFNSGVIDYSQDYLVISSSISASRYCVHLNKNITGSSSTLNPNLSLFTQIRLLPSPNTMILDVDKPPVEVTGRGFILPANQSPTFKKNLPNIIKELADKNLL